jgi:hypothetical protein
MDDSTLEQISALLDDKLRPIHAKLDEHSRKLERPPVALEPEPARPAVGKLAIGIVSVLVVIVAIVLVGRMLLGVTSSGSGQAVAPGPGRLLYSDDFSNPAAGLFLNQQSGTGTLPSDRTTAHWDYVYQDGALVAHVGAPSQPLSGRLIGGSARSANRLMGDFAFELRASATRSAATAVYGLRYFPGSREFGFGAQPGQKSYQFWELFQPPLRAVRSGAVAPDDQENYLRMEVRGTAVRLFINGQVVDDLQDDAFGARPASVGLFFDTSGSPLDAAVEIRYTDFKVYALGSAASR